MPRKKSPPSYRLHKARNCAVVTINGKNHYLGPYGSPDSHENYARLITEWRLASYRSPNDGEVCQSGANLLVDELVFAYWQFAKSHYVRDGKPTDEQHGLRAAIRPLRELYGHSLVRDFGPRSLKRVRQAMVERGHSRKYINDNVNRIRRMFRWGVSEELLSVAIYEALLSVAGLRAGRSDAREPKPIKPVSMETVRATLPHVLPPVAAMIEIQYLTGARPGEICIMRPCDITCRTGDVWIFRPAFHKTQHLDRDRWFVLA